MPSNYDTAAEYIPRGGTFMQAGIGYAVLALVDELRALRTGLEQDGMPVHNMRKYCMDKVIGDARSPHDASP